MNTTSPEFIDLNLPTRYGKIQGRLAVPPKPMRLSELAMAAFQLESQLQRLAIQSVTKENKRIACGPKCGACCRQAVPVSAPEAFLLAELVARLPEPRKSETLTKFAQAKKALSSAGFGDRSLNATATRDAVLNLGLDYFRLGIACPFLIDESCSIHEQRPTSCREFLVTSPALLCASPDHNEIEGVEPAISLTEALAHVAAIVMGGEPELIPMTLALDYAAENYEASHIGYASSQLLGTFFDIARQIADAEIT